MGAHRPGARRESACLALARPRASRARLRAARLPGGSPPAWAYPVNPPDWKPDWHRPMKPVVAQGVKPEVNACGMCHRAEGTGGPENASLAGLPAAYIIQQMANYKSGARSTALPDRLPQRLMIRSADVSLPAALRNQGRHPRGRERGADEGRRGDARPSRHDRDRGVPGVPFALSPATRKPTCSRTGSSAAIASSPARST